MNSFDYRMSSLDVFLGCFLGGALGDALGYPIEFMGGASIEEVATDLHRAAIRGERLDHEKYPPN